MDFSTRYSLCWAVTILTRNTSTKSGTKIGWKAALKSTYISLNWLKKYKLDMTRKILSPTVSDKDANPPNNS
jgi:hypothetical protein